MEAVPRITPEMTLLDIVAEFPQTEAVFRRYDAQAGACLCCAALFDTLTMIARTYRLPLDELVFDLESAVRMGTD
jgi:hypothetical protein